MLTYEDIVMLKVYTRQIMKHNKRIRDSLDDGDCDEYDILDESDVTLKQMYTLLGKVTKKGLTNSAIDGIVNTSNETK